MTEQEKTKDDPKGLAKSAITSICDELNIQNIVYVDDIFDLKHEVEQVIGWFEELRAKDPDKCSNILKDVPFDDDDIWKPEVKSTFENLEENQRSKVVQQLNKEREADQVHDDFNSSSILKDLFPQERFKEIGPSKWKEEQKRLIKEAEDNSNLSLCIFDKDLHHAKDFLNNNPEQDGIDLLQSSISSMGEDNFLFGIFSHKIAPDDELNNWRKISSEKGINKYQFLPLSKQRSQNASKLAFGFQMMVLNIFSEKLKNIAKEAFDVSHEKAKDRINELEVFDFHEMVMESSFIEGEWEVNTLLRLYQIFQRDETRNELLQEESIKKFNKHAIKARSINKHDFNVDSDIPNQKWEIRHQELYQDSNTLNKLHHPLRNGDIFRIYTQGEKQKIYMLLAQPCDLMIRANGTRDNEVATLVRLRKKKKDKFNKSVVKQYQKYENNLLEQKYPIYYIDNNSNKVGILDFRDINIVNLDVLDLAVANKEGRCKINPTNKDIPTQLNSSYSKRIELLYEDFRKAHKKVLAKVSTVKKSVPEDEQEDIIDSIMPSFSLGDISLRKQSFRNDDIDFGIKRILHYREPNSSHVLNAYTNYVARDAKSHDFAMKIN